MESENLNECSLHGSGTHPETLVGRRLEEVFASWHRHGEAPAGPLDVWLIDSQGDSLRITTGSDWCLIVEPSGPPEGNDMDSSGHVEVAPVGDQTPFAVHLGETVLTAREETEPNTGRIALEVTFASGRVRCESWAGYLRLST